MRKVGNCEMLPSFSVVIPCYNVAEFVEEAIRSVFQLEYEGEQPTLYRTLCEHEDWGKKRTDEYYAMWANMPNTQLELGEYRDLFLQSDAMIHDCGSFILEYLLVNKPCMFLQKGNGYPFYNEMNKDALKCYEMGRSVEDIERFIEQSVIGSKDDKASQRNQFIAQYLIPPHGKSAAENIIDAILYA